MQTAIKRDNCIIVILSHLYIEVQLFISIINFGFSILPKKTTVLVSYHTHIEVVWSQKIDIEENHI